MKYVVQEYLQSLFDKSRDETTQAGQLCAAWLITSRIGQWNDKRKEEVRKDILSYRGVTKKIETVSARVSLSETGETLPIINSPRLFMTAQVRAGQSYVDMDLLREVLGVNELKFEAALKRATLRRKPSVILSSVER